MPKSAPRRKRIRTARAEVDPTAVPESKGTTTAKSGDRKQNATASKKSTLGQERDKHLGPVLQKLSSDSADDRLWATAATSHILSSADSGTRRSLQSKNIVGLLIQRLEDQQSVEIQAEACGALRNLAIEGGAEVCAEMYNKNIVPKLANQLNTVFTSLFNFLKGIKPANENEVRVRKVLWIWIEHLTTLFWCLAETSDKAFKAIVTIQPLSDLLYEILKQAVPVDGSAVSNSKIPAGVALAAAQAVYVLTDVNVPSAPKFPLPRDVSKSAAYNNTRSMLLESLRNLTSSLDSSSSPTAESNEQIQSLLVMIIGIYQNLSQQKSFGKSASNAAIESEEQEFTRLTLRVLASLIGQLDASRDANEAIQAHSNMPDVSGKQVSNEAVQVSPQRRTLELIEKRWTTARLALEILGEIVAGVDGLLDPALLGEEEYEEWNGIGESKDAGADADMDAEDEVSPTLNGPQQQSLSLSTDIRTLLSTLPSVLMALGKPAAISFTSPAPPLKTATSKKEENLISTQIDMSDDSTSSAQKTENQSTRSGTYVPSISEVFSFMHVRAMECLNNLLITLARSEMPSQEDNARDEASPGAREEEDDLEDMDNDDDEEVIIEEAVVSEDGTITDGEGGAASGQGYVKNNLNTFQKVFEDLFHTLVEYQSRYRQAASTSQASSKNKDPSSESLELAVEASAGCIWALSRLCGNLLAVGRDEHRLLLSTLEMSLSQQSASTEIAIRCVGALGQLSMRSSVSNEENEAIGSALVSQLRDDEVSRLTGNNVGEIDLVSQILDTLFDVYGDELRDYEANVDKLGLVKTLEVMLPSFRRLTKSVDKRKYPETRAAAEAALLNLPAYVKYRKEWDRKKSTKQ
ncbi:hypothetical protein P389DRAFT_193157 [Cystobasidium minutum MCA 4210]|uniref:uncharacterized protein n=1 Tax=Cystobasidium minutum MCA 4210 TaxID=1397322 RepID=UPI0034CF0A12|eukprot:jgi/Rhomi1/193157/gm1.1371_g